jgi:hypothetical protein
MHLPVHHFPTRHRRPAFDVCWWYGKNKVGASAKVPERGLTTMVNGIHLLREISMTR